LFQLRYVSDFALPYHNDVPSKIMQRLLVLLISVDGS
jgi:hypothetical protein